MKFLPLFIAKRYLFYKKTHNIINIISLVSIGSIAVGTAALIILLSVFNGFEDIIVNMYNKFNPELNISPKTGKTITIDQELIRKLNKIKGIKNYSFVIEDNALAKKEEKQYIVRIKGVDSNYTKVNNIKKAIIDGEFILNNNNFQYCAIGQYIAYKLGINLNNRNNLIEIYSPNPNNNDINSPNLFISCSLIPSSVFSIQQEIDSKYIITSIEFAKKLFDYDNNISSIEVKLNENYSSKEVIGDIENNFPGKFTVNDRFMQQKTLYNIMSSEKWAIFFILIFIIIIATFNITSTLTIIILDKKTDIISLNAIGATKALIKKIFTLNGVLMTIIGEIIGIILGLIICYIQIKYKIITIQANSSFIINSYPVSVKLFDILVVFITVAFIGLLASYMPSTFVINKMYKNNLTDY